jgi:hypothetical protein
LIWLWLKLMNMIKTIKMQKLKDIIQEIKLDGEDLNAGQIQAAAAKSNVPNDFRRNFDLSRAKDEEELYAILITFAVAAMNATVFKHNDDEKIYEAKQKIKDLIEDVYTSAATEVAKLGVRPGDESDEPSGNLF